jgi:hypothetical protein
VQAGLPDVLVLIDGAPSGRTDARGVKSIVLEAKAHGVRVEKIGYEAPRERQVGITRNSSQSIVFNQTQQAAKLELRGAPAGVELRAGDELIGRTDGSPFSKAVQPGDRVLRVTEGAASRDISQRFEPGKTVTLDWAKIAPAGTVTPPPPKPNTAEQDWVSVSAASDPAQVQAYLDKYPNGARTADARSRLEALIWPGVNRNDMESLRAYINRFPAGSHLREASSRVAELVWNSIDKSKPEAVRLYMEQNPNSPFTSQAQSIFDQLEKQKLDADERSKQELAKQADAKKKLDVERAAVLGVLDRFNAALAQHAQREVKLIWPNITRNSLDQMTTPQALVKLETPQTPNITGDGATVLCKLTTQESRKSMPPQQVEITLQKRGGDWIILKMAIANR